MTLGPNSILILLPGGRRGDIKATERSSYGFSREGHSSEKMKTYRDSKIILAFGGLRGRD